MKTPKSSFDWIDMFTIVLMVTLGVLGWSMRSEAGFYVDAGVGVLKGLEAQAEVDLGHGFSLNYEAEAAINDLPFFMFRGGYEYNGFHFELQTTGVPDYHYETFTVYKRWRF